MFDRLSDRAQVLLALSPVIIFIVLALIVIVLRSSAVTPSQTTPSPVITLTMTSIPSATVGEVLIATPTPTITPTAARIEF